MQPHFSWMSVLAVLASPLMAQGQVVLNEFMANNLSAVAREGAYPDWVELYNPTLTDVSLAAWSLTDNLTQPTKYVFPLGTVIRAKGFLVIWCDGATNKPLHTAFSLSENGEELGLFGADTQLRDVVTFGLQSPNLALGRVPDATGPFTPTQPTPGAPNRTLSLGTPDQLKINEWMASPSSGEDWFELYNPATAIVSLSGLYLSDRTNTLAGLTNRPIPALSFLGPGGFVRIIADDLGNSDANHVDFKLSGNGEQILLFAADRSNVINRVDFGPQTRNMSEGRLPDGSDNIVQFAAGKATPGESNFQLLTNVVVNEVLTHTDPPFEDAIELHNPTAAPVDISYWWLSNSRDDPKKFRIPPNTIIQPGGFKVFYEYAGIVGGFNPNGYGTNRSFTLNSANGDQVYLYTASNDISGTLGGYRASQDFGAAENRVALGRYVTSQGKTDFVPLIRRTFGQDNPSTLAQFRLGAGLPNAEPKIGPLIIRAIFYHPPDVVEGTNQFDNLLDEYVEIYNPTTATVFLFDTNGLYFDPRVGVYADGRTNTWRVRGVVDYDFPTNVSLAPGRSLLLINFDPVTEPAQLADFRAKYRVPADLPLFGPYSGKLENGGGSLELYKPDPPQGPDHPDFRLVPYILVERVKYSDSFPWPVEADGAGAALERITPEAYGNDPINWRANMPAPGRQNLGIDAIEWSTSTLTLHFQGLAGSSYTVQQRDALGTGPGWTAFTSIAPQATTGVREVAVPISPTGSRFYRITTPAQP